MRFLITGSQAPSGNRLVSFRMLIAETATADFEGNLILFPQEVLKFLQRSADYRRFVNGAAEKNFLRLESCFSGSNALRCHLSVSFLHLFLPPASCLIFPVSDFLFCTSEQVYLMKLFPMAEIHHFLLQVIQVIIGKMVLVTGTGIAGALHKVLVLHIIFSHAVDHDMYMNVAAFITAVRVGTDESLVAGEIFTGIL